MLPCFDSESCLEGEWQKPDCTGLRSGTWSPPSLEVGQSHLPHLVLTWADASPECWDLPFHRGGMTVWCVRFQNPCRNTEIIFSKRRLTPSDLTGYWKKDRKRRYKSQTQTNPHRGHTSLNKLCFRINIYTPPSITITFYPLWAEHWQLGGTRDRSDEYSHSATTRSPWLPFLDPIDSKTNNMR